MHKTSGYQAFLGQKAQATTDDGFQPWVPDMLFPFQRDLVEFASRGGRRAVFADCGLGKTFVQLAWAEGAARSTNGRVLVLTPLAVSAQTVREGAKLGVEVKRSHKGEVGGPGIYVTNYERLHLFDPDQFAACVCDESSILKNFSGKRKREITEFMRRMHYRLLCTATASPNDYVELGTSSEALGHLGYMDMLERFFRNEDATCAARGWGSSSKWRFKKHAKDPFWRWVCSWARAARRPSDLGHSDIGFDLPPLTEKEHVVPSVRRDGMLFALPAEGLDEEREERRATVKARCERAAALADHLDPVVLWCDLNEEGDLLEKLVPGAVQVSGRDSDEAKEERFTAFSSGEVRALVTKPKIGGFGLNWQHCAHEVLFPSHSFERYYQAVRRCWRFGQTREVVVDVVASEGERGVLVNLRRKAAQADEMFDRLVEHMNEALRVDRSRYGDKKTRRPKWL